jgi:hypothetical protein
MKRIFGTTRDHNPARSGILLVVVALVVGMVGYGGSCVVNPPSGDIEIHDWYDLDDVRDNLAGSHILMNDLDSTTRGYQQLASPTANGGKGWQPIGTYDNQFTGSFDGQGYEIRELFIHRPGVPGEEVVGLFGWVGEGGRIKDIGVQSVNVTGVEWVGALIGWNYGSVSNSYSTGSVAGTYGVGGLLGVNEGPVSDSYFIGNVTGDQIVGGLMAGNDEGTVSNSYSTGSVTGTDVVGGLMAGNFFGTVSNCYFTGTVTGEGIVGGLMSENEEGTVINSYSTGSVTGISKVGGLMGGNYGTINNCYSTGIVYGEKEVGGLLGRNTDTVSNSYSTSSVTGTEAVGGLVGVNQELVSDSYSIGNVTGNVDVGGLVGLNRFDGITSNSFWDIVTSGQNISDGGTGKNTTEMQDIATFSLAGWNIIAVALNETNPAYIWNIVDDETCPFLSWQS